MSRRHAVLLHAPSGTRLLNDRSFNGTLVNGQPTSRADLANGDVITLGRVTIHYLETLTVKGRPSGKAGPARLESATRDQR